LNGDDMDSDEVEHEAGGMQVDRAVTNHQTDGDPPLLKCCSNDSNPS
jgi:hypothetical protein